MIRIFSTLLLIQSLLFSQEKIQLAFGEEWYPYNYIANDSVVKGMDLDIAQLILNRLNLECDISTQPWSRALLYMRQGERDMMMGCSQTDERKEYAWFTIPYRAEIVSIVTKTGDSEKWPINSLSEVKRYKLRIGMEKTGWYGDELESLKVDTTYSYKLFSNTDQSHQLNMLLRNRYDMIIYDKYALLSTAKQCGVRNEIEVHPYQLVEDSVAIMFSKKNVDSLFVEKVNTVITELHNSGEIQRVIDSYLDSDSMKYPKNEK
jgi:polar amino acid transport system substrate-binding protein